MTLELVTSYKSHFSFFDVVHEPRSLAKVRNTRYSKLMYKEQER